MKTSSSFNLDSLILQYKHFHESLENIKPIFDSVLDDDPPQMSNARRAEPAERDDDVAANAYVRLKVSILCSYVQLCYVRN